MTTKLSIPTTELGKSYWNKEGLYEAEYNELYDALVPASGMANTLFGEVVRAASRLGYDYYNNGNCNAYEQTEIEGDWVECSCCHGSGICEDDESEYECCECGGEGGHYEESEYETSIHPLYEKFLRLIREFFEKNMPEAEGIVDEVEEIILTNDKYTFSETEEHPYVLMIDAVIYIIKSKVDKLEQAAELSPKIPEWYKN